jgi:transcriptional regulator with PAS, ATPase and Fis domain
LSKEGFSQRNVQELQTFIDTANAPIFGIDAKGRVNEWNKKVDERVSTQDGKSHPHC